MVRSYIVIDNPGNRNNQ